MYCGIDEAFDTNNILGDRDQCLYENVVQDQDPKHVKKCTSMDIFTTQGEYLPFGETSVYGTQISDLKKQSLDDTSLLSDSLLDSKSSFSEYNKEFESPKTEMNKSEPKKIERVISQEPQKEEKHIEVNHDKKSSTDLRDIGVIIAIGVIILFIIDVIVRISRKL